jgi:DNA-binding PadR family transcriptional regulator
VPPAARNLPTTGYVVLGLLSFGRELTGYECKQWADGSLRFFFSSPAMSQIYDELERLQRYGYVRSRDDSGGADRSRRTFRITAAGTTALRRWLDREHVGAPVLKHSVALRIFLGHLADPERLDALLAEHAARTEAMLEDLDEVRADLAVDDTRKYAAIVAEWSGRFYEGDLEATRAAQSKLRELTP